MKINNPFSSFLLISLFSVFFTKSIANNVMLLNVINFGAKSDGKTDSSNAFLTAWDSACGSSKPATIYVPKGNFSVKQVHFKGKCKNKAIIFRIDGTLVAPLDYNVIGNDQNWILFQGVDGVSILGGSLDGQGSGLWTCKSYSNNCPRGATVFNLYILTVIVRRFIFYVTSPFYELLHVH